MYGNQRENLRDKALELIGDVIFSIISYTR